VALTLQQVVDRARKPLNDAKKTRWPDATLLEYTQDAIARLLLKRPDLFVGQFSTLPDIHLYVLADDFPLEAQYVEAVADYVRARAQLHDTEPVEDVKAPIFMQLAGDGTMG
jgi:hypothetical protein